MHRAVVGSYGGGGSYERGTPVPKNMEVTFQPGIDFWKGPDNLSFFYGDHQPPESEQIAFFESLDLCWKSPDSGDLSCEPGGSNKAI